MKAKIKYLSNGKEIIFNVEKNKLNNANMFWFEPIIGMYHGSIKEIKQIIKDIEGNSEIKILSKEISWLSKILLIYLIHD